MTVKQADRKTKELLRERALHKLPQRNALEMVGSFANNADNHRLVHELMVHQIELEMQNEELLTTKEQTSQALDRYTELFEFAPICYCTVNENSELSSINLIGANTFNLTSESLMGKRLAAFVEYDFLSAFNYHLDSVFSAKQNTHCELRLNINSKQIWMQANFKLDKNQDKCFIALTDITKQKIAEEEIRLAATVYESLNEAVVVANNEGNIIAVNPSFIKLTGMSSEQIVGQSCNVLRSKFHNNAFYKNLWQSLQKTGRWQGEVTNNRQNGQQYMGWLTISTIYDADKNVSKRVGLLTDITEKKRATDLIEKQANFDSLTGLPNRRLFNSKLMQELLLSHRKERQFALFSIDLDQFKDINDSLGHQVGDQLLIEAALRLQKCIRNIDTVSRLGGDEFTIIMSNLATIESTGILADRILQTLNAPFHLGDNLGYISASVGIAIYPDDGTNIESLIKNADQAMYAAKNDGRNCKRYFTLAMQDRIQKRLSLSHELRSAIENNEFWVAYQPIIDLNSGLIQKAESLLRWEHPELGNVPPMEFIPIAEESGLISNIGDWAFEQVTLQTQQWLQTFPQDFQISINMSPAQFRGERTTHKHWLKHLKRLNLNTKNVAIEITEGLLMDMSNQVMAQLESFDTAGIEISLDDFGTGYSSLSYLKKFHIDYLKIDLSFVKNLEADSDNMALCEAIIVLAHKLGLKVIAEGIETIKQRDLLTAVGCDYGQGYLFSKPLSAVDFEAFVRENLN